MNVFICVSFKAHTRNRRPFPRPLPSARTILTRNLSKNKYVASSSLMMMTPTTLCISSLCRKWDVIKWWLLSMLFFRLFFFFVHGGGSGRWTGDCVVRSPRDDATSSHSQKPKVDWGLFSFSSSSSSCLRRWWWWWRDRLAIRRSYVDDDDDDCTIR